MTVKKTKSPAAPVKTPTRERTSKKAKATKAAAPAANVTVSFSPAAQKRLVELEAKQHAFTSPTAVESPFTPEERAVLAKKIPCPALAGIFTAGMLKVEKDGTVKIPDLDHALSQLGPSTGVRKVLTRGADKTDELSGSFNLFKLNGSNLDHTGSSGIRQNGIHPERFELLKTFSKDGQRLTPQDLSNAAEHFAKEDPGLKGRVTQQAEMNLVMQVFGQRDDKGKLFLTFTDAHQLFVEGRIPSSWSPPAVPGKLSVSDVLGGTALGVFRQLLNGR